MADTDNKLSSERAKMTPEERLQEWDNWLPKEDMVVGKLYRVKARNFKSATWNGEYFEGWRNKLEWTYLSKEYHWDDGAPFGTCKPLEELK